MTSTLNETAYNLFFKLLLKCPSDRLQKLFHHLIDIFCGQKNSQYENYADVYSMLEWWDLTDQSKVFLKEIYSSDQSLSVGLQSIPEEYSKVIKAALDVRTSDLKKELIERSHSVSPTHLTSFDWKVKLTLASDKVSQINEPRLLLDLGLKDKTLQLDMGKDELKSLIDTMEKIKTAVLDLKTAEI